MLKLSNNIRRPKILSRRDQPQIQFWAVLGLEFDQLMMLWLHDILMQRPHHARQKRYYNTTEGTRRRPKARPNKNVDKKEHIGGPNRDLNPGPPAFQFENPKAGIIRLDHSGE